MKRALVLLLALCAGTARAEWAQFTPVAPRTWLTGQAAIALVDPGLELPVYLELPARPYQILGYVRVIEPAGPEPRRQALELAAATGRRHGGEALLLIEPAPNIFATAAVIRWL